MRYNTNWEIVSELKIWAIYELELGCRSKATRINKVAEKYFNRLSPHDQTKVGINTGLCHKYWRDKKEETEIRKVFCEIKKED